GSAIKGLLQLKDELKPEDVVVVLFHDSGSRYIAKIFNDDWMREKGYLEENYQTAEDLINNRKENVLAIARTEELVSHAIDRMRQLKISQLPVRDIQGFVGSVSEQDIFEAYLNNPDIYDKPIKEVMNTAYPIIAKTSSIQDVSQLLKKHQAVLVHLESDKYQI